jgi:hypothetical protein
MKENLPSVNNTTNPPNNPQARLIEILWGMSAQKIIMMEGNKATRVD